MPVPQYSFIDHARMKEPTLVGPANIIFFEGLMAFYDKRIRDLLTYKIFINCDGMLSFMQMISAFVGGSKEIPLKEVGLSSVSSNSTTNLLKMPSETSFTPPLSMLTSSSLDSGTIESQLTSSFSTSRTWPEGSLSRKKQSRPRPSSSVSPKFMILRQQIPMT